MKAWADFFQKHKKILQTKKLLNGSLYNINVFMLYTSDTFFFGLNWIQFNGACSNSEFRKAKHGWRVTVYILLDCIWRDVFSVFPLSEQGLGPDLLFHGYQQVVTLTPICCTAMAPYDFLLGRVLLHVSNALSRLGEAIAQPGAVRCNVRRACCWHRRLNTQPGV